MPLILFSALLALVLPAGSAHAASLAGEPQLGQSESFWVMDWEENPGNLPSSFKSLRGTVRYVGRHSTIYVEQGQWVPFTTLGSLSSAFDAAVYPSLQSTLGPLPDPGIDGQHRIALLVYRFNDPSVSGYFNPLDIDPLHANGRGPADYSNRREILYLNLNMALSQPEKAPAVAAHELAHLLVYYHDYMKDRSPSRAEEDPWVEEGLAGYAELIAGYPDAVLPELGSFALDTNKNLTRWDGPFLSEYGASYAFVTYLAERAVSGFIARLVQEPADGISGIDAALKATGSFDTFAFVFDDWVIANSLNGRAPLIAPYRYHVLEEFAVEPLLLSGPLPRVGSEEVQNYGSVYVELPEARPESVIRVVVDGEDGAPLEVALLSWDSEGRKTPVVTRLSLAGSARGGSARSPAGFDRHTLVTWSRGPEGLEASYRFRYSLAADPASDIQFLDIGSDHLFFSYISNLLLRGVITGSESPPSSGLWYFRPGDAVLRSQFAKMIVGAVNLHTPAVEHLDRPTFADVRPQYLDGDPVAYPFDYVEEAATSGIVSGFPDGTFRPWEPVTRLQLVRMVLRSAKAVNKPLSPYSGSERVFTDVPPGSPLYAEVMTAYENGITSGSIGADGKRYFLPWDRARRGQVAKMTAILLERLFPAP